MGEVKNTRRFQGIPKLTDYIKIDINGKDVRIPLSELESLFSISIIDTAIPYREYEALVSQSGTDAPTTLVQANSLGYVPTYAYTNQGNFRLILGETLSSISKCNVLIGNDNQSQGGINYAYLDENDLSKIIIQSKDADGVTGANGKLYYTSIRIKIYE
jgi:hypothetical protein